MNIEGLSESGKTRAYDSPARRAQAKETRRQIADAARHLFVERGWSRTRVKDVAAAAGVSEPTVYAVYGSKAGLVTALLDSLEAAADVPRQIAEIRAATGDPLGQLAAMTAFDRRLFEHGADAMQVIREAAASRPELIEVVSKGRGRGDRLRRAVFGGWPDGTLRPGVDEQHARDTFAALCNLDVYLVLTRERGWSPDRVQRWWTDSLATLLLA
jgi:AcrR family transcriptional regulator